MMRVRHRTTDHYGTILTDEPDTYFGGWTWLVLWDDTDNPVNVDDDDLHYIR